MAFCSKCGTKIANEAAFCGSCGAATSVTTSAPHDSTAWLTTSKQGSPSRRVLVWSGVVLVGFFLPWVQFLGVSVSGYQIGNLGSYGNYVWVIPLLCGGTILVSLFGLDNRLLGGLAGLVPIGALIYALARIGAEFGGGAAQNVFEIASHAFSIGAYLTVLGSLGLLVSASRPPVSAIDKTPPPIQMEPSRPAIALPATCPTMSVAESPSVKMDGPADIPAERLPFIRFHGVTKTKWLATSMAGALVVALIGGGVAYYGKTQREAELLVQQNLAEQRIRDEQAAGEARRTAGQLALQDAERFGRSEREKQFLQWVGTWKSQDGRKTIEISASSLRVSEEGDRGKYELAWSPNPVVDEGRFGYLGKSTSQAEISKQYEDALNNFQRDSTDFHVSPPDSSRQAIAALSSGYYDIVQGYLGGDCGLWEWVRDNDKLLEISHCKYHFIVNTLTRVREL